MLVAIALNAVVIFFLYFPKFQYNHALLTLDHLFIVLYVIEAIVKIRHYGWKRYWRNNWNKFDFIIVLVCIPSVAEQFTHMMPDFSFLLILRLFRLIRLVKFMVFIPRMNMMMQGLGRAMKASLFVMLALLLFNFMLALFTCHFYRGIAPEHFGNPLTSSYTIFQMFTVEGWNEIPALIAERSKSEVMIGLTRFYFVLVVLFGGIFGMSLANAIFVDEMTMDNNKDLEEKIDRLSNELHEIKQLLRDKNA